MWCIVGGITFFWGGIVFGMFGFPFLFSFSWFLTGIPSVFLVSSIFWFGIWIVAVTVITIRTRCITVTWFTWGWDIFFRFPFAILFHFLPYTFLNMLCQQVNGYLSFFLLPVLELESILLFNLSVLLDKTSVFLSMGSSSCAFSPSLWVWLWLCCAIVLLFLFWCKKDFFIGAVIHLQVSLD